ncbi:hypothetical protein OG598_02330 [Micromonospora sp. NBC_00330]|uniref:hypothetical protein n=1 Tax=Micromonospora sp. NBC_00330 TaxID=2903585 RepID=UPI002E2BA55F|nr:hypothetical protein [Micromonospora sp. NBC_00330]
MKPLPRARIGSRAVALVAALAAALLAACTPGDPPAASSPPATAEAPPATRVTAPPLADFCPVAMPPSWQDAIRDSRLPQEPGEKWAVLTPAPDGRSAFATVQRGGSMTLVWQEEDGRRREVATMPDMFTFPLWGVFDGRWLVYARSSLMRAAPHGGGGSELFAWDAESGTAPRQVLGTADFLFRPPLRDGKLAVTRIIGEDRNELTVHDLAAGTVRTVATGPVGGVGFHGADLLWFDRATGRLNAVGPDGRAGSAPQPSPGPGTTVDVTTDGRTTAWVSRDERTLTVWRPDWAAPVRVFRVTPPPAKAAATSLPPGTRPPTVDPFHTVATPTAVGDLVIFRYHLGWYVADLRTGSYVRLTADHAHAVVSGEALLVDPDNNSDPAQQHAYSLLRPDRLPPLPACP